MPSCAVPTCKNVAGRKKKDHGITFHLFPSKEERKTIWTKIIQRARLDELWKPSKGSVVCSKHFKEQHFYDTKCGLKRLRKGAFPDQLPNDMENYMEYTTMGKVSRIIMKSGCLPRNFACQPDRHRASLDLYRPALMKRRRLSLIKECEEQEETKVVVSQDCENLSNVPSRSAPPPHDKQQTRKIDKAVQLVFNDLRDSNAAENQPGASSKSDAQYQTSRYSMVEGNVRAGDATLEEIIIKEEITEEEKTQCRLCLSVGRKMQELDDYAVLYRKLLFENNYQNSTIPSFMFEMLACWECLAELRRVRRFQQRVRRANAAFETGQNLNCGNLSNLCSVLIGETKTPRLDENLSSIELSVQNIKKEACEIDIEETALPDPLEVHQEPIISSERDQIIIEVPNVQIQTKTQTPKAKSLQKSTKRAATEPKTAKYKPKRAKIEQNVPDAEVSQADDNNPKTIAPVDSDEIFGKVKIEFDELQRILEDRRNKESFKSMKYKCDSCVLGFTDYNRLQEHNTSFHDEEVGSCSCDICDRRFDDDRQLSAHYRNHFVKFVCILCDFECYTKTGRMIHFKRHKGAIQGVDPDSVLRERLSQASAGGSSRS